MRGEMKWLVRALLAVVTVVGAVAIREAHAGCNLIPGTSKSFEATLGATNRPFAAPGEAVEVRTRPCDGAPGPGLPAAVGDHVVTIVFQPPAPTPRHVFVLAPASGCATLGAQLSACQGTAGVASVTCLDGAQAGLGVVNRNGIDMLTFTFPDTDALVGGASDDQTLAGPAAIGGNGPSQPLPCALAPSSCAALANLRACVDQFFANDGACGTAVPLTSFPHFTALPPPNV